jgi:hypothetical protein
MSRTPKYKNADDLFANCKQVNDCLIWPQTSNTLSTPTFSPMSTLAMKFNTTSIVRVTFTLCRHIPSRSRLVRCCDQPYCINPYHYVEATAIRKKRLKNGQPNALLPDQEGVRDLIAPPEEELRAMRPKDPDLLIMLANSALTAGYDGRGILNGRGVFTATKAPKYADPNKPLLVIRRREEPPKKASTFVDPITPEMETEKEGFLGPYFDMLMAKKQAKEQERLIAQGYPDPIDGRDDH